ncbi:hypothetical protein ElyMa_005626200 [Elysia marginata]|uniref:Ig-like domain-containing protein n=1 Tax=Elysia marginata TaxID=1093978 RepID=A0AAV4F7B1_9GAST|nr:hypothetical protein ElyMa_005626200 [Elysia marginata]
MQFYHIFARSPLLFLAGLVNAVLNRHAYPGLRMLQQATGLVLLMIFLSQASGRGQSSSPNPRRPFSLTLNTPHVILDVTRNIRLDCGYDGKAASQIRYVSSVRLMKKSNPGWTKIAETKWYNVSLRARTDKKSNEKNLLKYRWNVADESVFGIYRCDVIGFDKMAASIHESSTKLELPFMDLTSFLIKKDNDHHREMESFRQEIAELKADSIRDREKAKQYKITPHD